MLAALLVGLAGMGAAASTAGSHPDDGDDFLSVGPDGDDQYVVSGDLPNLEDNGLYDGYKLQQDDAHIYKSDIVSWK